jgi:hypothetical protein
VSIIKLKSPHTIKEFDILSRIIKFITFHSIVWQINVHKRKFQQARSQEFAAGGKLDPWGAGIWVNDVKFFDDLFRSCPKSSWGANLDSWGAKPPAPWLRGCEKTLIYIVKTTILHAVLNSLKA